MRRLMIAFLCVCVCVCVCYVVLTYFPLKNIFTYLNRFNLYQSKWRCCRHTNKCFFIYQFTIFSALIGHHQVILEEIHKW
jgi:hypothetical protein